MTTPQHHAPAASGPGARLTLARDLAEFLVELSIALNKFSIYPGDHPALEPALEGLVYRFDLLLEQRSTLSVGVARRQLVIEGVATDPRNPVLADLAGRFNRHQLGAITFTRGVERSELLDFLNRVALDADRSGQQLASTVDALAQAWPHIRVYPPMYDRLDLIEEEGPEAERTDDPNARSQRTRAAQLWVGLARAALAGTTADESLADGGAPASPPATEAEDPPQASDTTPIPSDPAAVARAIEGHSGGAAYDQVVVGYMLQIAEELREAGGQEAVQLRKRMSRLVSTLEPKTLERLLAMGGDGQQRHQFLLNASQGMAVDAVVDLIRAAGETEERPISQSMLRMLNKLALNAGSGGGERRVIAEQSVRDQVGELLRGWSLEDPNPEAYGKALDAISRSDPLPGATEAMYVPEPQRIIEMALEVDVLGDALTRAVDTLVREGQL